jgi:AraC-like DNA-binding protein
MDSFPKKLVPPVLRIGHLMAFTAFLDTVGTPVDLLLRRQRLPVLCDDPDYFIPLLRAWSFFDTAARGEDPMLGWLVGQHVGDHNLNYALLRKLEGALTLYQALHWLAQKIRVETSELQLGIYERPDDVLVFTHYPGMVEAPGYPHSQAYQIGVILDLIRHFLGRQWVPEFIGIECQRAPAGIDELFPGTRILTGQQAGYIAVPRTTLHQAARRTEAKSGVVDDPVLSEKFDFIGTLRAVLKSYLPDGYPSARFAAKLMDVSERTLARRLSANGLTYGALVDEVRFKEAKKLLQEPRAKIGDVALSVGFYDQSNFTRMFRRIGGLSPKEFLHGDQALNRRG